MRGDHIEACKIQGGIEKQDVQRMLPLMALSGTSEQLRNHGIYF